MRFARRQRKTRHPRSPLSFHLYREYSPALTRPDKAPTRSSGNDTGKAIFLLEFGPDARSNGCRFLKSSDPDRARARWKYLSTLRPNFPFGDCRTRSSISLTFTFRMKSFTPGARITIEHALSISLINVRVQLLSSAAFVSVSRPARRGRPFFPPATTFYRNETSADRIFLFQSVLDFLPGHRRRDGRLFFARSE